MGEEVGGSIMKFDSLQAFLEMGGYGLYVWSAYGITLIVFAYSIIRPILMKRAVIKEQKRLLVSKLETKKSNSV